MGFKKIFKGIWRSTRFAAPFVCPVIPGGVLAQRVIEAADQKFSLRDLENSVVVDKLCREWMESHAAGVLREIETVAQLISPPAKK